MQPGTHTALGRKERTLVPAISHLTEEREQLLTTTVLLTHQSGSWLILPFNLEQLATLPTYPQPRSIL